MLGTKAPMFRHMCHGHCTVAERYFRYGLVMLVLWVGRCSRSVGGSTDPWDVAFNVPALGAMWLVSFGGAFGGGLSWSLMVFPFQKAGCHRLSLG